MPNVLWDLQGINKVVEKQEEIGGMSVGLELDEPGRLTKVEFDENMADLTAFLVWVSDPTGQFRKQLGVWVLLFLGVFVFVAWRLNAAYWKDIK